MLWVCGMRNVGHALCDILELCDSEYALGMWCCVEDITRKSKHNLYHKKKKPNRQDLRKKLYGTRWCVLGGEGTLFFKFSMRIIGNFNWD